MSLLTIALDVMGGDNPPSIILSGAITALQTYPKLHLIICGDAPTINVALAEVKNSYAKRITVLHCQEVISMSDKPSFVLRRKKDASMRRAIECVATGKARACVSAGNTGALFALASYILKTLPGIDRPALVSALPTLGKEKVWLLDLGANVNNDAETLLQNAVMGSVLANKVEHISQPRVALLNVGEENIKGNPQVKAANDLLKHSSKIHYIGYLEGHDIFANKADVVVTDGFTGNVALKSSEGLLKLMLSEVKRVSNLSLRNRFLAAIALPLLKRIFFKMKPDQYNGASLIGLQGIVVKSHGNATGHAFFHAIKHAIDESEQQVPETIRTTIESIMLE
jgi:glycerol-3-phosphate acyltransferase PlsX